MAEADVKEAPRTDLTKTSDNSCEILADSPLDRPKEKPETALENIKRMGIKKLP